MSDFKWISVDEIKPHPKNRNLHDIDQLQRLAKLIESYGWRHPLIISNQTGFLIVGHGRLEAAKYLKQTEVPVDYQDFESEDEEYGFMVADNAIARWAELDVASINLDLPDLGPDFDPQLLGLKNFSIEPADKKQPQRFCANCGANFNDPPKTT